MHLLRRLADTSPLEVHVYSDFFLFAEQYDHVLSGGVLVWKMCLNKVSTGTLINVATASLFVIAVSLLLIPAPGAALWVSATIISINVGLFGLMALWNVRLDFVSMVTIVMSIGFCVDFSAHLAYHFAKVNGTFICFIY